MQCGNFKSFKLLTFLPKDCKQMTTEFKFCRSQRSTDWNVSWTGTPKAFAASRNAEIFSMHLKAILLSLTFLMVPGWSALVNLQRMTPSLRTSKKLSMSPEVLMGSPVTSLIHSRLSAAKSSLYFELICKSKQTKNVLRKRRKDLTWRSLKAIKNAKNWVSLWLVNWTNKKRRKYTRMEHKIKRWIFHLI